MGTFTKATSDYLGIRCAQYWSFWHFTFQLEGPGPSSFRRIAGSALLVLRRIGIPRGWRCGFLKETGMVGRRALGLGAGGLGRMDSLGGSDFIRFQTVLRRNAKATFARRREFLVLGELLVMRPGSRKFLPCRIDRSRRAICGWKIRPRRTTTAMCFSTPSLRRLGRKSSK